MATTTGTELTPARPQVATRRRLITRRRLAVLAITLSVLLLAAYFAVSSIVADRLSHPRRVAVAGTPAELGMQYEDVQFNSAGDNIPLKGWYIDSPGDKVILVMHGRNNNRAGGALLSIMKGLHDRGYDAFAFDFRAHGESGGERYSLGLHETRDVAGALQYLEGRGVSEVGGLGFSMGAATELLAAPNHPQMKALVSDSSFASLPGLLDKELPKASGLPGFFNPGILFMGKLLYDLDLTSTRPVESLARLNDRPLFLIHGTEDALVPVSHAYDLQKAAAGNPNLEFWVLEGAKHTGSYDKAPEEYMQRLLAFYDKHLP
ncbi:MAG: alpha/beta hydrolase [Chloroflexota bacterium]|nr:alpha/beta hydrolase [Chloroflexota bacterium]MDQ5867583.1 alpha/beta hydrolase [Chloroflexota bacterium]